MAIATIRLLADTSRSSGSRTLTVTVGEFDDCPASALNNRSLTAKLILVMSGLVLEQVT
jgi:hypothetical protein